MVNTGTIAGFHGLQGPPGWQCSTTLWPCSGRFVFRSPGRRDGMRE